MLVRERYTAAINSKCLTVDEKTTMSDTDVLGAYGLAAKTFPLGVAIERLLSGDTKTANELVSILSDLAWRQARRLLIKINIVECLDIARCCIAWLRSGTCQVCKGHGFLIVPDAPVLSENECKHCASTGKIPFSSHFKDDHRPLAEWLVAKIEQETAFAGPEAMKKIAPKLDL